LIERKARAIRPPTMSSTDELRTKEQAMKILLAVDGSAYTKRMLGYAAAHEELFGPQHQYTVITVVPPVPPHASSYIDRATLDDYYTDEAKAVLEPVLAFATQKNWLLNALHPVGHAGDVIAEAATSGKFDLVVMGSHGHSSVANLVLGSVVSRVLAQCKTPLLIIR
jgi:nucleotide-binding universal stress UspA family protein